MIGTIIRRDTHGVLLRYATDLVLVAKHTPPISNRVRIARLRAPDELKILGILFDHLDISEVGRDRIDEGLDVFADALELPRIGIAAR